MAVQFSIRDQVEDLIESYLNTRAYLEQEKRLVQELIDQVLTPEQRQQIQEIREEFQHRLEALEKELSEIESGVKARVLELGHTVEHRGQKAVYNKGRATWDTKALDGLMIAIPSLQDLRKEGNPYVAIKWGEEK